MVAGFLWANAAQVRASAAELTEALAELITGLDGSPEAIAGMLADARVTAGDPL
jgi:hypothetical protein